MSAESIHVARAAVMVEMGRPGEARQYLRHVARLALAYSRILVLGECAKNRANQMVAERERQTGIVCALASRRYRGHISTAGISQDDYSTYVPNPHWPRLDSHGVYVWISPYLGTKPPQIIVEVQILPPDENRTQCCAQQRFTDNDKAGAYARKWIAVGKTVIAAQEKINRDASKVEPAQRLLFGGAL